jgi:phosphoglycerol transferase MdoB-like AlkP superfamily enzyme
MTEQIGWGLNDRDFLQQMVPRLERLPRPFAAWLITLSLHHPYDGFPANHRVLKLGALENTAFGNYLHTMRFFDQALEDFRTALARGGLLDDTVLVVFGDHDAGFPRDRVHAKDIGIGADEISWTLTDRVPLFIRVPTSALRATADKPTSALRATADKPTSALRATADKPQHVPDPTGAPDPSGPTGLTGTRSLPAGQTDFAPTVLALLGIDAAPLPYVGRNLLGGSDAPVVRPYGDWLDTHHLFLAHGAHARCYDVRRRVDVAAGECGEADRSARRARQISRLVVAEDLQQRLLDRMQAR